MNYVNEIINKALQNVIKDLREKNKPYLKYRKRVANRNQLHKKRLKLGRVRKR